MRELILFSIEENNFAIDLEKIKRIVEAEETTTVAGNADSIEGVFTFENQILNVLSFRSMIGVESYVNTMTKSFPSLKEGHEQWVEALRNSVKEGVPFEKAVDPYECALGKWLESFSSYDDAVSKELRDLFIVHSEFHQHAEPILAESKTCVSCACAMVDSEIEPRKDKIMSHIDALNEKADIIVNSMQKFLILDGERLFAVRIDGIDDIISIDESAIQVSHDEDDSSHINIGGIFEHENKLINLISSIVMPETRKHKKGL